jgi:hypothetical protein
MTVLLDTPVVIDCLRKLDRAERYFRNLDERPFISVITMAEIMAGVRNRREEGDAVVFWSLVKPLRVDQEITQRAGVLVRLFGSSHAVELPDALIAATAEHHGLRLATLNIKHFPMFKRLRAPY